MHGFWWSADSKYLIVERFDESGVEKFGSAIHQIRKVNQDLFAIQKLELQMFLHHFSLTTLKVKAVKKLSGPRSMSI